ncbi:FecR family protein [Pleomorphovibrio marinus]|uniref:FecR family protein n=1 Tax=Pleomorphovibrio marinus TaxID=2164132 RepID=UPI000E0CBBD7|nr:FecR domain-containing protein [Pleomorphovibrio marinus]
MTEHQEKIFEKYLIGKCSPKELEELFYWFKTKEGEAFLMNAMDRDYPLFEQLVESNYSDPTHSEKHKFNLWLNVLSQVPPSKDPQNKLIKSKRVGKKSINLPFKVAAVFLCFLVAAISIYSVFFSYDQYQTGYGQKKEITLSDGSQLTLNGNSTIRFSRDWKVKGKRELWLDGEAFFNVNKVEGDLPFQVYTSDNLQIEVLGTQFNVAKRKGKTQIVLNSGSLAVNFSTLIEDYQSKKNINRQILVPGELLEFDEATRNFNHMKVIPENYSSWKEGKIVLSDTKFKDFLLMIEETYGVEIQVNNQGLWEEKFNGSIPTTNIDAIFHSLSLLIGVEIEKIDHKLYEIN